MRFLIYCGNFIDKTPEKKYNSEAEPCEDGGIGRRARLRGVWETVRVQLPFFAPIMKLSIVNTTMHYVINSNIFISKNINECVAIFYILYR